MDFSTAILALGVPFALLAFGTGGTLAVTGTERAALLFARICFVVCVFDILGFSLAWAARSGSSWPWLANIPILGLSLPLLVICLQWISRREWLFSPRLQPSDKPTPPIPSGFQPPPGSLLVFLGTNMGGGVRMPHTVLSMGNEPMLALDRDKRGHLNISIVKIYDANGDAVIIFENHKYRTGPMAMTPERPDQHTLVVHDRKGVEVLRLVFLNPQTLSMTGLFRRAGSPAIEVTPTLLRIGGNALTNCVFFDNGAADIAC